MALGLGLGLGLIGVLALEGAVSVWTGGSLLRGAVDPSAKLLAGWDDDRRAQLAQLTDGPFDLDHDPEVGHRTKAKDDFEWVGVRATTDEFGMRVRPGGWPAPSRPRWVVLGDSVAFGLGVADDQTYAARIERHVESVWRGDGPPPAVLTVAAPGWNLQSSTRFLRNHLQRYRPSLVILMPVENDLENRFVPTAFGGRAYGIDPAAGLTRISVSTENVFDLRAAMSPRAPLSRVLAIAADGGFAALEHVLVAGLAPESRRRFDEAVDAIALLRQALAGHGAGLFVLNLWGQPFARELDQALVRELPDLRRGFLFDRWQQGDALVGDSHPNAAFVDAGSIRAIQLLARGGMLPAACDTGALTLPAAYASRVVEIHDAQTAAAWRRERIALLEKYSGPRIDLVDATGFQQIYAGVEPDGTIGALARVALRGQGGERQLVLRVRPPAVAEPPARLRLGCSFASDPARPDGEPVWIDVPFPPADGDEAVELRTALPADLDTRGWIDVQIRSSDHGIETVAGRSRLTACRLVEIGIGP